MRKEKEDKKNHEKLHLEYRFQSDNIRTDGLKKHDKRDMGIHKSSVARNIKVELTHIV